MPRLVWVSLVSPGFFYTLPLRRRCPHDRFLWELLHFLDVYSQNVSHFFTHNILLFSAQRLLWVTMYGMGSRNMISLSGIDIIAFTSLASFSSICSLLSLHKCRDYTSQMNACTSGCCQGMLKPSKRTIVENYFLFSLVVTFFFGTQIPIIRGQLIPVTRMTLKNGTNFRLWRTALKREQVVPEI